MKNIFLIVGLGLFLTGCDVISQRFGSTDSKSYLVCDGYEEIEYRDGEIEQKTINSAYDEQHALVIDKSKKIVSFYLLETTYTEHSSFIFAEYNFFDKTTITLSFDFVTGELSRTNYAGVGEEWFRLPIVSRQEFNCKKVEPLI